MTEPSDLAREMLARYRGAITPSDGERTHFAAAVDRRIESGVGAGTLVPAARRAPWLTIVGVAAAVGAGALWAARPGSPSGEADPRVAAIAAPAVAPIDVPIEARDGVPAAALPSEVTVAATSVAIAETAATPPTPAVANASRRTAAKPVPEEITAVDAGVATVDEEVRLLREASVALRDGKAAIAKARYDEHARRFPQGSLVELREVGLVLLACQAGDAAGAAAARRFTDRFPSSPHAERIDRECGP